MLIDWFTVAAQAVNFLILVWLLKRFLYKPILAAIDAREKAVAARVAQAASVQEDAQKNLDDLQKKSVEFDRQRADLLSKAIADGDTQRQKMLDDAKRDFDALRSEQQETLSRERASAGSRVAEGATKEVFEIARKALSDLASTTLEASMATVFIQRLRALGGDEKARLDAGSPNAARRIARVRSTFEMPPAQQAEIAGAVKDTLGQDTEVTFEATKDLVSGIELTTEGYKVSWNISDYLTSLEEKNQEMLKVNHAS